MSYTMSTDSTENDYQVVKSNIDFFLAIREACDDDEFRYVDVDHPAKRSMIVRARNYGLVRKVGHEWFRNDQKRFVYTLTERGEELIATYERGDTICPCSCRSNGFHHREDGYHCPNEACDEGPWTKEELDV